VRALFLFLLTVAVVFSGMASVTRGSSSSPPQLSVFSRIGWNADKVTGANVCTVASRDPCATHEQTNEAGGFGYPVSVAVNRRTGDVYVAEIENNRVQEFTQTGVFVAVFGWRVNKTKDSRRSATQAEKNVCTAVSGNACTVGTPGTVAGQMDAPESLAVDPRTGDVYVLQIETGDLRIDKYTPGGRFLWRIGKGVNLSSKDDLCGAREADRCGPGVPQTGESPEPGAFKYTAQSGDLLAVDRSGNLYVGDEHRIQAFAGDGRWLREISLTSISAQPSSSVVALALDEHGDIYLAYRTGPIENLLPSEHANIIHKFNSRGEQMGEFALIPTQPGAIDSINAMAIDGAGDLAVMGIEVGGVSHGHFGFLYHTGPSLASGIQAATVTEFQPPADNDGIAFGAGEKLYITTAVDESLAVYAPAQFSQELIDQPSCQALAGGRGVVGWTPGFWESCVIQ
jgi:hypothetical protein